MKLLKQYISDDLSIILLIIFLLTLMIQLYYVLSIFLKLAFFKKTSKINAEIIPVSVIICARNESDQLILNLPKILEQNYAEFEVIVVNHQSIDNSKEILEEFSKQYRNLKIVELQHNKHLRSGKKLPLTIGIKAAKYEQMLTACHLPLCGFITCPQSSIQKILFLVMDR